MSVFNPVWDSMNRCVLCEQRYCERCTASLVQASELHMLCAACASPSNVGGLARVTYVSRSLPRRMKTRMFSLLDTCLRRYVSFTVAID